MIVTPRRWVTPTLVCLFCGGVLGFFVREIAPSLLWGQQPAPALSQNDLKLASDSPAAFDPNWKKDYPQYQPVGKTLKPFPDVKLGEVGPDDVHVFGGAGKTSFASVDDVEDFDTFYAKCVKNKAKIMAARKKYMDRRYDFSGRVSKTVTMTRGKPVPVGPVVRLPEGISSWEELGKLDVDTIREKDLFPLGFQPLSHPNHAIGHQLFPQFWLQTHSELKRFDVDFDIPEAYLPEFPPPMFLTTRPDLGDVSQGYEVTQANFRKLFDGVITPEQMEGLRLLVTKFPTSWFNHTKHRLTKLPVRGVACFDCHVNGHTNGAIELDPGTRPTLARVRLDTPTLRGNHNLLLFSLRRSIRSLDHFAEVEEYFDGDISLQPQIGGRQLDRVSTNRMGDFNAIIGWPPAPKLDLFGKLIPAKATPAELRGEALFHGKAKCSVCHPPPFYTDDRMHDLCLEKFFHCRAEGWAKTFPLRGIKDSPPYFHDGRLPTLEDTVEFFNLVFELRLTRQEKSDLTAFLKAL